jgi:hypothetical protein
MPLRQHPVPSRQPPAAAALHHPGARSCTTGQHTQHTKHTARVCSVPVVWGLEGPVGVDVDVGSLVGCQLGQLGTQLGQVEGGNLHALNTYTHSSVSYTQTHTTYLQRCAKLSCQPVTGITNDTWQSMQTVTDAVMLTSVTSYHKTLRMLRYPKPPKHIQTPLSCVPSRPGAWAGHTPSSRSGHCPSRSTAPAGQSPVETGVSSSSNANKSTCVIRARTVLQTSDKQCAQH